MAATRQSLGRALKQSQNSLYVCRSCKTQLARQGILIPQQRFASNEHSVTSKSSRRSNTRAGLSAVSSQVRAKSTFLGRLRNASQSEVTGVEDGEQLGLSEAEQQNYVQAETWDGLEFVGSSGKWQELPSQPEDEFNGWLDPTAAEAVNRAQLVSCLHRALVECLTSEMAGLDSTSTLGNVAPTLSPESTNAFASASFVLSSQGRPEQVEFGSELYAKTMVDLLSTSSLNSDVESAEEIPAASTTSSSQFYTVQDESFLKGKLGTEDPRTFMVLKRFSQLSGHRVPDPILNSTFSANKPLSFLIDKLDNMVVQPKPKKLAEILMQKADLNRQGNVLVFPRRETSVDKEKEVGRWKIIEKELEERGLPVLGRLKAMDG